MSKLNLFLYFAIASLINSLLVDIKDDFDLNIEYRLEKQETNWLKRGQLNFRTKDKDTYKSTASLIDFNITPQMKKSSIIRILTAALVLTACGGEAKQNINPEVPVKSGDWFSVSASSGDTIEKEDISLEIAKGTFGQDVKIAITEVKKGSVMGNDEQSPFYQITVDEKGTKKPIVVKIRYAGDPDEVQAVIKMPTYSFHESKFVCEPFPINSSAGDGFISVTIPEMNPAKGPSP